MSSPRREVGFLPSLAKSSLGGLLWPEGVLALILGVGGGTALLRSLTVSERISVVGDGLALIATLLGVVFAAFALLIALFSNEYVLLLDKAEGGVLAFLRPFMIAIGVQVTTVFVTIAYKASATDLDSRVEVGSFLAWGFLFSYAVLDVVALARSVTMHGLTRMEQVKMAQQQPDSPSPVRNLRDRAN